MYKKVCKIGFVILYCIHTYSSANAQEKYLWKMQPIAIQTRWAKNVNPDKPLPEYPRPQMVRGNNWQNLNGLWDYAITQKDASRPTIFQGQILVPFPLESALSGVKKALQPDQLLWYKRTIAKPEAKVNDRVLLHFGAVDWQANVYVNGREVASHTGGYTAFSCDITNYLKDSDNELLVKVYDPTDQGIGTHGKQVLNPSNMYYTSSSGIWQTVWLETVPAAYISDLKLMADIDKGELKVQVNTAGNAGNYTIEAYTSSASSIKGRANVLLSLPIANVHLWSPDDPYLYNLTIRLLQNGKVIDEVDSYFGMRKIEVKRDGRGIDRLFLNNNYIYHLGVLDQGFWPDGLYTAPVDDALAFDIKACKAMGFNTIRKHIKVEPARWYYHADKIGMLVWQDFVNPNQQMPAGSKSAFENEVEEILDQLHNYPSITTWVLFNEKWGAYDQQRLTEWVKKKDPSRLVNGHSGELLYVNNELRSPSPEAYISADITDVHSYPFPRNAPEQPGKARVLGEFGGIGVSIEGHLWDDLIDGWGYDGLVTPFVMQKQYEQMVDSLEVLERDGLSASIYTQPFDVEGEENGLMTYDREIIKIPLNRLREINKKLNSIKDSSGLNLMSATIKDLTKDDTLIYQNYAIDFENGKRDSAFLRRLTLMSIKKKDFINATKYGNEYIGKLSDPLAKSNLIYINKITHTSKDKGFELFRNNLDQVNLILGNNQASKKISSIICREEIEPYLMNKESIPNWNEMENNVRNKYGMIGQEVIWGERMVYHWFKKDDWKSFGKYYMLYYQTAASRSKFSINTMSWDIFLHIEDTSILKFATNLMKYNNDFLDKDNAGTIDTYANLLYKLGKKEDAIIWEEKAVKLSNNEEVFVDTLNKMLKGTPTWN